MSSAVTPIAGWFQAAVDMCDKVFGQVVAQLPWIRLCMSSSIHTILIFALKNLMGVRTVAIGCELEGLIHERVLVSSPVVWCLCLLPRACIDAALGLEQRWGALGEIKCFLFVEALKPVTVPVPNPPLLLLVPSTAP